VIVPASFAPMPKIKSIVVVLPAPFGPTKP
jgi:hypothetical protein